MLFIVVSSDFIGVLMRNSGDCLLIFRKLALRTGETFVIFWDLAKMGLLGGFLFKTS